ALAVTGQEAGAFQLQVGGRFAVRRVDVQDAVTERDRPCEPAQTPARNIMPGEYDAGPAEAALQTAAPEHLAQHVSGVFRFRHARSPCPRKVAAHRPGRPGVPSLWPAPAPLLKRA